MALLRIALPGEALPGKLGPWPLAGPRHRLVLDPALAFAAAVSAVSLALRETPTAWIVTYGRAAAPFLAAVGADLGIGVAGALILAPQPWSGGRALDLSPLPFPAVLVVGPADAPLARAWGATQVEPARDRDILTHPAVIGMIRRRSHDLARAGGLRVGVPYAAVAGTVAPPG